MEQTARSKVRLPHFFAKLLEMVIFVGPAMIAIATFVGVPFLMCIYYSFFKWNGIDKNPTFIGIENYIRLFTDDIFKGALNYTFVYCISVVIIVNAIAILFAVLIEEISFGKSFFRTAFYIPNVISLIVIGFVWKFIFGRVFSGLYDLTGSGVFDISWLGDPHWAVITTVFVTIWQSLGFYMIIYIAGLQTVPPELNEAASLDGANAVKRFFAVTLPMIMPAITFCLFHSISSTLKMFELIFSLTGGGPGTSTTPVALDIYNTAFSNNMLGYGSAKSVVLFFIVALITVVQISYFKGKEVQS